MADKLPKTNVMRVLDQHGVSYTPRDYSKTGAVSGSDVARALGLDPGAVFKTLVTVAGSGEHYVFMVPVEEELDLKKAARAVCEKSIEMIKQKELLPLTGYVHGGCSPIGMKKQFVTVIDETAELFDAITFSAGKIGYQVELPLSSLRQVIDVKAADICEN